MNKPDWSSAPEWAEYLAMDGDGEWWWYEVEPTLIGRIWSDNESQARNATNVKLNPFEQELAKAIALTTLEKRP